MLLIPACEVLLGSNIEYDVECFTRSFRSNPIAQDLLKFCIPIDRVFGHFCSFVFDVRNPIALLTITLQATQASAMYAQNMSNLLKHIHDKGLAAVEVYSELDPDRRVHNEGVIAVLLN